MQKLILILGFFIIIAYGWNLSTVDANSAENQPVSIATEAFEPLPENAQEGRARRLGWEVGEVVGKKAWRHRELGQIFGTAFEAEVSSPIRACEEQAPQGFWRAPTRWDIELAKLLNINEALPVEWFGNALYKVSEATPAHGRLYSHDLYRFRERRFKEWAETAWESGIFRALLGDEEEYTFCVAGPGLNTAADVAIYRNPSLEFAVVRLIGRNLFNEYQEKTPTELMERRPASLTNPVVEDEMGPYDLPLTSPDET